MASVGIQFGGNNSAVLDHRGQSSLCVCSPYSNRSVSMIRGSGGKRGNSVVAMARAGLEAVGRERRRGGGNGSEAAAVAYEKLDEWMRESVVEIVRNLREAPLLVNVYGRSSTDGRPRLETEKRVEEDNWDGLRRKWEAGVAPFPDGVIFVEELDDNDNGGGEVNGKDDGGDAITKAWGLVVQGKGQESGPACYLLKTSKVNNGSGFGLGMGLGCTHFCLVPVSSFREKAQSQLKNCWLLQA
ncbi:hypothetical protein C1H46_015877 [Malus baccata]|uniref:DUF7804 domain-containing protein n=1 Tax=Malus baccata TaxID=106549 RepID=A0A540MJL0_MALBA|nr:hypothetical protein C1H46_015877 [Malus baccata]